MNCPIHLGEIVLDTDKAAALPCGHVFCLPCITRCFIKSRVCPICKEPTKREKILHLFLLPKSPCPSPAKKQLSVHLSAAGKTHARALREHLQALDGSGTVDDVFIACAEMVQFADNVAESPDVEANCLAEDVRAAAMRLQDVLLAQIKKLTSVRAEKKKLDEENAILKSTLHLKEAELDSHDRRRISAENELVNAQMAKKLADDKASGLRETLSVKSERLVDAENTIRQKDEKIQMQEAEKSQYRRWISDHKKRSDTYKTKIKELERRLLEHDQVVQFSSPGESSSQGSLVDICVSPSSLKRDHEVQDDTETLKPLPKRRRVEEKPSPTDMKLDRSCFVTKPPPSFKLPVAKRPEKRSAGLPVLNMTNDGQVKGPVVLGSMQRLGKRG